MQFFQKIAIFLPFNNDYAFFFSNDSFCINEILKINSFQQLYMRIFPSKGEITKKTDDMRFLKNQIAQWYL